MEFNEVPNLVKFEEYVSRHPEVIAAQQAYQMVKERIAPLPSMTGSNHYQLEPKEMVSQMTERCRAIEESTRIIWACAAVLGKIEPDMFEEQPTDLQEALNYFWQLEDLQWMEITREHRVAWEQVRQFGRKTRAF